MLLIAYCLAIRPFRGQGIAVLPCICAGGATCAVSWGERTGGDVTKVEGHHFQPSPLLHCSPEHQELCWPLSRLCDTGMPNIQASLSNQVWGFVLSEHLCCSCTAVEQPWIRYCKVVWSQIHTHLSGLASAEETVSESLYNYTAICMFFLYSGMARSIPWRAHMT